MKVLVFFEAQQTFTNTVLEHISSFAKYSENDYFFCDSGQTITVDLDRFDAVILHYTVRLPFDLINDSLSAKLEAYIGLKALFIQDEYDHTHRAWYWIKRLGIGLVFTVVPKDSIVRVYPPEEFPNTLFVNNLTGYVPDNLPTSSGVLTSARPLTIAYRGRSLPVQYGQLGFEKVEVGRMVKAYCVTKKISHDIAWDEKSRIYGANWYKFMASCRSMLGSESGSNVFDWDGTLARDVAVYQGKNQKASLLQVYRDVVSAREILGLMNQVSPRVFEAIALRTALVMFRGNYSGVVVADEHYIPLDKDGGNLPEVFKKLADGAYVDAMVDRAYRDVIASGKYAYAAFVRMVDAELAVSRVPGAPCARDVLRDAEDLINPPAPLLRAPGPYVKRRSANRPLWPLIFLWENLPEGMREILRPLIPRFLHKKK